MWPCGIRSAVVTEHARGQCTGNMRGSRCQATQPGNMPPTAPLASTAVRGNGVSDKWNSTEVAELDSVSYVSPVVDDFDWEGPSGGAAGHVAFSDMETIENADTQGGGWGQWGGEVFAANVAWCQQQWRAIPGELEPMALYNGSRDDASSGSADSAAASTSDVARNQAPPPATINVIEDQPERYRFHSALYTAAMRGDPEDVTSILRDMEDAELQPGPAAQHALVFSHIKAGNAMEGLRSARESVQKGIAPLEETYVALVFGLVEEGLVESAEGVVLSMYNAGRDTRNGWLALAKGLFRKGLTDMAFQHLQKGLQEGWNPDASLYEHVLRAFCASGNVEQAQRVLSSMPDLGVPPCALHFNILVEAIARTSGLDAVTRFIQQGFPKPSAYEDVLDGESQQQDVAAPNADTFCAIFRGLMDPACTASVESVTEYAQVSNLMQEMDVAPGPRIVALGLRRYLQDGELDLALEQVATLRHAAGDEWSEHVPETDIVALLTVCGRAERPLDLAVLLRELDRRGRRLAGAVLPSTTDAAGRSVSALTSWLSARVGTSGDVSGSMLEGGLASQLLRTSDVSNYDGSLKEVVVPGKKEDMTVYIGIANCVVDETGRPMPVAKMRRFQIVTELQARGSETTGKVGELRSVLQLQRNMLEARIDAWFTQNEDEGGLMMSRVRALIASGMSMAEAMNQVQNSMKQQIEVPPKDVGPAPGEKQDEDQPAMETSREEEEQDDFGIKYSTEFKVVQYDNWNRILDVTMTYGQMDEQDRAAVRKLRKYEQPSSATGSLASRRQDALRGVVDDAQVSLERGEGWDDEDAAAEGGLLGQFEGDMLGDGNGDEASLSDGVGAPETQPGDLGDSAVGLMEEEDGTIAGLEDLEDDDEDTVVLDDGAADEDEPMDNGGDPLDEDAAALLVDEEIDDDHTVEVLDLSGQTNESASIEVAVECLRCARLIGLVITHGDFEAVLDCARTLERPEIVLSLHGWALDQAGELLVDADRDDDAAVRSFTRGFVLKTRSALKGMGHAERIDALQMNEEDADFL